MITVYGRATSSNVQIVMWAIAELGLAHKRLDYGHVHGGVDTDEYRALNPNGLVPTIRDRRGGDDVVLWESAAILRYLADRYGEPPFRPADPARRARLDMWAEWTKSTFVPAFNLSIFWPLIRTPKADRDDAALAAAVEALKPIARRLDERLGEGPWLDGAAFTFADVMAGHTLFRYFTVPIERAETPALDAYYARLRDRPTYREHVMVSYEPLRAEGA
ncbi:MAG: glutathione S-transferase family protein [Pseudomonadota bacterium]